ncbi:YCR043C [Saccharomyces arboricola H-6]|uniref:YCR043C n=1 Tax=Saccharomyces arboricola (strain H-6 / AS 2.3317 / CBS 10644) TaxID=1160507 RepID=J8Q786_SACAR|nr:YCR043C [Saccharomyces arboricola H-6]
MIPPPLDASLLREHAYQGTNDLSTVLSPNTFTDEGGYKPVLKYGLGYFNYGLVLDDEVYDYSVCDIIRGHVYDYFWCYFYCFIILCTIWIMRLTWRSGGKKNKLGWNKKKDDFKIEGGDLEYQHVKV